jgi:hypothetical protein
VKTSDAEFSDESGASVGPNLSFTHGRFWITAALLLGFGDGNPTLLPRIVRATGFWV